MQVIYKTHTFELAFRMLCKLKRKSKLNQWPIEIDLIGRLSKSRFFILKQMLNFADDALPLVIQSLPYLHNPRMDMSGQITRRLSLMKSIQYFDFMTSLRYALQVPKNHRLMVQYMGEEGHWELIETCAEFSQALQQWELERVSDMKPAKLRISIVPVLSKCSRRVGFRMDDSMPPLKIDDYRVPLLKEYYGSTDYAMENSIVNSDVGFLSPRSDISDDEATLCHDQFMELEDDQQTLCCPYEEDDLATLVPSSPVPYFARPQPFLPMLIGPISNTISMRMPIGDSDAWPVFDDVLTVKTEIDSEDEEYEFVSADEM